MARSDAEIAAAAYRAFNLGGIEAILDYLDPGIEWRMWPEFSREPRIFRGHDGVREVLALFEDNYEAFRADPHEVIETESRVVVPVRLHGVERGSGEHHSFELVQVWTTREQRAVRLDVYASIEEARAATGSDEASDSGATGRPR